MEARQDNSRDPRFFYGQGISGGGNSPVDSGADSGNLSDAVLCGCSFLHTSPELHMKRLFCGGLSEDISGDLAKCFRDGERGSYHLPEFRC